MYEFHVQAHAQFEAQQSLPQQQVWRFSYQITITNTGDTAAQLIARHWLITDAHGVQQEVHGLGVVGQQPLLQPGETYTYSSACELPTSTGRMQGRYLCVSDEGEPFVSDIPEFLLDAHADAGTANHADSDARDALSTSTTYPASRTLH